jgi:hypothetical protein
LLALIYYGFTLEEKAAIQARGESESKKPAFCTSEPFDKSVAKDDRNGEHGK